MMSALIYRFKALRHEEFEKGDPRNSFRNPLHQLLCLRLYVVFLILSF
jgi:hypothetical protein